MSLRETSAGSVIGSHPESIRAVNLLEESRGVGSGNRAGSGIEPGTGSVSSEMGRRLKMNELVLRFLTVGLAVVSAVTVGTDSQTKYIFDLPKKANFRLIRALVFLVVVDAVVAGYSLIQGFRCISSMHVGSILLSRPLAWLIFTFDQAMTYITLAAAASAAEASYLAKIGESEFQWMKVCNLYGMFCTRIGVGFVSAFVADLCMVIVSGMSAYHLFRLYGPKCKSIP